MASLQKHAITMTEAGKLRLMSAVSDQFEPVMMSPVVFPSSEERTEQTASPEINLYEDYEPVVISPFTPSFLDLPAEMTSAAKKPRRHSNPRVRRCSSFLRRRSSPPPTEKMAGCTPPAPLHSRKLVFSSAEKVKRSLIEKFAECSEDEEMTFWDLRTPPRTQIEREGQRCICFKIILPCPFQGYPHPPRGKYFEKHLLFQFNKFTCLTFLSVAIFSFWRFLLVKTFCKVLKAILIDFTIFSMEAAQTKQNRVAHTIHVGSDWWVWAHRRWLVDRWYGAWQQEETPWRWRRLFY